MLHACNICAVLKQVQYHGSAIFASGQICAKHLSRIFINAAPINMQSLFTRSVQLWPCNFLLAMLLIYIADEQSGKLACDTLHMS